MTLAESEPLLISADELARLLGVSARTIWRRLSSGDLLEPVHFGGVTRWRREEVKNWVAEGCPRKPPFN
jgi:excisionase family DNA binding protein